MMAFLISTRHKNTGPGKPPPSDPMRSKPSSVSERDRFIRELYRKERVAFERDQKIKRYQKDKGSRYPSMNIEPFQYERWKLSTEGGFTDTDRRLRKEWLESYKLAKDEPRYVPELRPMNFFRRLFAWPYDTLFNMLRPIIREPAASMGRRWFPKLVFTLCALQYTYYYCRYYPASWEHKKGWAMIPLKKPPILPDEDVAHVDPQPDDFHDRGFKSRTALLDVDKTSFTNYRDSPYHGYFDEGDNWLDRQLKFYPFQKG